MNLAKNLSLSSVALLLLVTIGCNNKTNEETSDSSALADTSSMNMDASSMSVETASASITGTKADTTGSGTANFIQNADGTVSMDIMVEFPKMANKSVAVHLHEHGDCSDGGKGAHGHWNPTNESHGKWGSEAFHSGDIGNIELDEKGKGEYKMSTDRWSLGGDEKTNILSRAVIVHSGIDDYKTQPTGNAGSRIGCGVITGK